MMRFRTCVSVILVMLVTVATASAVTVDFETPPLGLNSFLVINPYVDAVSGVTFTAVGAAIGIVKNNSTSACADPADANQKLGTGPAGGGSIGFSSFPMRADFPGLTNAPVTVSVEFQCVVGAPLIFRLYNAANVQVAAVIDFMSGGVGTCGFPGPNRARKTLSLTSVQPVAWAFMDVGDNSVLVLDNFTFVTDVAPVPIEVTTWGGIKSLFR